jgi:hypothetical protein
VQLLNFIKALLNLFRKNLSKDNVCYLSFFPFQVNFVRLSLVELRRHGTLGLPAGRPEVDQPDCLLGTQRSDHHPIAHKI